MGTHPIFESDFDCLTDMSIDLWLPSKLNSIIKNADLVGSEKTERIGKCLFLAKNKGGQFWPLLERAADQIISEYHLSESAKIFLLDNIKSKSPEIVDFMAPFMLIGQDTVSPLQEVIQKGLIYDLMLRLNKSKSDSALLRPLISAIESVNSTEKEDLQNSEIPSENLISENGQN